jgi:hypothetical protein
MRTEAWRTLNRLFAFVLLSSAPCKAHGDVAVFNPIADTTLIEAAPSNNLGGMSYVNSGTTQNFTRNRGLFRFDVPGTIPSGSWVSNATFIIEVVGKPQDGFTPADFALHRMLKPWGEGNKIGDPLHPGLGGPATEGDATWSSPSALTTNSWSEPGGGEGKDFVAEISSEATIYAMDDSPYTFNSTPALVADVRRWVDQPGENFGWILISRAESASFTARRFGSRENTVSPPLLRVEYLPPPLIEDATIKSDQFVLQFTSRSGLSYVVEFKDDLTNAGPWLELANFPAASIDTGRIITDPVVHARRIYRLRIPQ